MGITTLISTEKSKMAGLLTTEEILQAQKLASAYQKNRFNPTTMAVPRSAWANRPQLSNNPLQSSGRGPGGDYGLPVEGLAVQKPG